MNEVEIEDGPGEIPVEAPRPGIRLGDILYVLFRHKWKIILVVCGAAAVAATLPFVTPRIYQSEAKLFIRYVLESKSPGQMGANDSRIKSPDERGENVINTELEILTSLDLAQQVADAVGPDKILGKGGGTNSNDAATVVRKNLLAEVPRKSNVIRVVFQHSDPDIVQPVLKQIIESYLTKHGEIHRSVGVFDDFLGQETVMLRSRLLETEDDLRKIKARVGVTTVEGTTKVYTEQIAKVQQDILSAEADLAERQAAAAEMAKLLPPKPATPAASAPTNSVASTNDVAVPPGKLAEYRRATRLLDALRTKEQEFLLEYTPSNSMVISIREQLATQQKIKQELEELYPGLLAVKTIEAHGTAASAEPSSATERHELAAELAKASALQSKIKILTGQLDKIQKAATAVYDAEGQITELQRKKELEEAHYKYFAESLEQSRIDGALGAGRVSNISKIQAPSPPYRVASKLLKMMAGVFFGGLAGAFGLAFVTEFFLDQSLRRPSEVQSRLQLPLFISIPLLNGNGHKRLNGQTSRALLPETTEPAARKTGDPAQLSTLNSQLPGPPPSALPLAGSADSALRTPHSTLPLAPFYDALRDRLITHFEIKGLTHKPKLVALTSCGEGAGVSTIAAGLAASLSETGDGNVLLVDMNLEHGAAHPFYRGKLACGLDDALALEKRGNAQVQENLYVVQESTNGDKLPRVLPRRFTHLLPKLKASDYDYIIFDMPPISHVSVTPRLSRFMDVVLTVVECEKTDRQLVQDATGLLVEGGADVGIVLNKRRQYVPRALHQEL